MFGLLCLCMLVACKENLVDPDKKAIEIDKEKLDGSWYRVVDAGLSPDINVTIKFDDVDDNNMDVTVFYNINEGVPNNDLTFTVTRAR